ncbi:hypothetical protein HYV22_03170 [Candidatus Gottesmanbacteria bacterium]|nr:hypothetical protein [Candidatus Gottesmanbacteria bacterium]
MAGDVWVLLIDSFVRENNCPSQHWNLEGVYTTREFAQARAAHYGHGPLNWFDAEDYSAAENEYDGYEIRRQPLLGDSHFTDVAKDEYGNPVGNCLLCGTKGVLIEAHTHPA